ncbi:MAG: alpha-hydroxy acid oxidase [Myxococcota bacterium]|nr:alpha-hydroxy acid oxidase [Myxococcota bacterium]
MLLNLQDYEEEARKHLDAMTLAYYSSGADSEHTLRANRAAWQMLHLRPRSFVDVSHIDTSTTVLGQSISFPVLIPPMAFQQLAHPNGEAEMAKAAGEAGTIFCLSTISNIPMQTVIASTKGSVWFQLYVDRDRKRAFDLVQRAEISGARALVVTVDTPILGNREKDVRLGFKMPSHLRLPNLPHNGHALTQESKDPSSALANFAKNSLDPTLSWKDLEHFASQTNLPIIAKGILREDDARRAVDHGAKAIVVSNHGGRQLDTAIPTAWALPEIVDAVGNEAEVYVDGGIRRGTDILKALCMGAKAVFVGRPMLWGLSVDGQQGCQRVLAILRTELERAMALSGAPSLPKCTKDLIWQK